VRGVKATRFLPFWPVACLFLVGLAAALVPPPRGPLPPRRHEDPSQAASEADPGALLRYYAAGLSQLSRWRVDEAKRLLLRLDPGALPPELQHYASDLTGLVLAEGDQLAAIDRLLHDAAVQARTGRVESARRILAQLRRHVERGTALLGYAMQDVQAFAGGARGTTGGAQAGSASREAYQELARLAARARALLAAYGAATRAPQSAVALTRILPYPTEISLSAPKTAYPGRPLPITGAARELAPSPSRGRHVALRLDGRTVAEVPLGTFRTTVILPPDMAPGAYRLVAEVPARGRYLAGSASQRVDVIQARPVVTVRRPGLVLAPGHLMLSGTVRSRLGPLAGARVRAWTEAVAAEALAGPDGRFEVNLAVPGWLQTLGPQDLRIRVLPREPWDAPVETSLRPLVLSLPGIALGGLAACATALWAARGRRRETDRTRALPAPVSQAPGGDRRHAPADRTRLSPLDPSTSLGRLLQAYEEALRRVQAATGLTLLPSTTLREFAGRAGAIPGGTTFARMTALAERAVYAGRRVERDQAEEMERLGAALAREVQGDHP